MSHWVEAGAPLSRDCEDMPVDATHFTAGTITRAIILLGTIINNYKHLK